jgi:carbonic anhydrase
LAGILFLLLMGIKQKMINKASLDKSALLILHEIVEHNGQFVEKHDAAYFEEFMMVQRPRMTLVTCADSRVHAHAFCRKPDNDIFMVRNIGGQLKTAAGSVKYGVRYLRTRLLFFMGHSGCGAVTAATEGLSGLNCDIQRELESIVIPVIKKSPTAEEIVKNVEANVHKQVAMALEEYSDLVISGHLIIVGGVYDFKNDYQQGQGSVVFINVNGSQDPLDIQLLQEA